MNSTKLTNKWAKLIRGAGITAMLAASVALAACGANNANNGNNNTPATGGNNAAQETPATSTGSADKSLTLAYVAWDSEIASTHVVQEVLTSKLGYDVNMLQVDAGPMYVGITDGSADAMVAAWLPGTHGELYYEPNKEKFEDLGPNLDGTKIGLAVPTYMDIDSIEDLKQAEVGDSVDYTIVGIEPGAGLMNATEQVLVDYELDGWNLLSSSSAAMARELQTAYAAEKPIIVTAWTPHWKFAEMDLKYLEDPQLVYGGDEQIHTLVRLGLAEDHPDAYQFLDQFVWEAADMEAVMIEILNGVSEQEAAKNWIAANEDKVNAWLAGIE